MAYTFIPWVTERLKDDETTFKAHIRMVKNLYKPNQCP